MWSAVSLTVPQKCLTLSLKAVKNKQKAGNKLISRRVSVLKQLPHACKPVFKLVVTDNSGNSNRAFRSLTVKL